MSQFRKNYSSRLPFTASQSLPNATTYAAAHRTLLAPPHQSPRAFTLLEVIIVIGIVVLLTALTVTVAVGVSRRSEIRSTENVLTLLDLAMSEWTGEADRQISWGINDEPLGTSYEMHPDSPQLPGAVPTMLSIVLDRLNKHPASQSVLRQIDGKYLKLVEDENDPTEKHFELRDAWDNQIYIIHPGRVADPRTFNGVGESDDIDEDGTIRVSNSHAAVANADQAWEGTLGVCKNRRICFVSAGPDGDFGNISDDSADPDSKYDDTLDNLYSYPVGQP